MRRAQALRVGLRSVISTGNTVEEVKEKLQYDLYYIKNVSIGLDLLIMFQTIKIVLWGRGAQ